MPYQSISSVIKAGIASEYGGFPASPGAVFVYLKDKDGQHDWWFEVPAPWGNQALATALAAVTSSTPVEVFVGDKNNAVECNSAGDPYCYRLYLSRA